MSEISRFRKISCTIHSIDHRNKLSFIEKSFLSRCKLVENLSSMGLSSDQFKEYLVVKYWTIAIRLNRSENKWEWLIYSFVISNPLFSFLRIRIHWWCKSSSSSDQCSRKAEGIRRDVTKTSPLKMMFIIQEIRQLCLHLFAYTLHSDEEERERGEKDGI